MIKRTQRKSKQNNTFSHLWNEFLFARNFEYETPLTPNEVANVLKQIEKREHRHYFLSFSTLKHKFTYMPVGDKSGDFKIELETATRNKWWDYDSAMLETSGTISVDAETGMTTVQGNTQFSRNYYLFMLLIFVPNFWINTSGNNWILQLFWISFIVIFWYVMYGQRNKLANEIDNIIMNAKIEHSLTHLMDDAMDEEKDFIEVETRQEYSVR
ncbi:MAG: hypothetical protein AAF846_09520 [Chloroflexota bacterium]